MKTSYSLNHPGAIRIVLSLIQAALLFGLYRAGNKHSWPATVPGLYFPAILLAIYLPVIAITALRHLAVKRLLIWLTALALILSIVALHDWYRRNGMHNGWDLPSEGNLSAYPSALLFAFSALSLFIAQSLRLAFEQERKIIANYASYFDLAWKLLGSVDISHRQP